MVQVTSHENPLLERGDIYFLYRPRVDREEAHGPKDVERFYMLLKPWHQQLYRLIVIGRKRLPDPKEHNRFYRAELNAELGAREYQTKTRGLRHVAPARPAAEGVYALVRHGNHTHLAYVIEHPEREGPVERDLNIEREASYIIAVRNPKSPRPPGTGLDPERDANFPKRLQEKFAGRKFLPVDPPDLLNYVGAELIFIGASDPERESGLRGFKIRRYAFPDRKRFFGFHLIAGTNQEFRDVEASRTFSVLLIIVGADRSSPKGGRRRIHEGPDKGGIHAKFAAQEHLTSLTPCGRLCRASTYFGSRP